MKLGYSILYVPNVPATIAFYENAFGLARRFITPDNTYGELETGATTLSFANIDFVKELLPIRFDSSEPGRHPLGMEIGLVTQDVDAAYLKAVEAGAIEVKKPAAKPWGQVVGYVRDMNGFLVEICSPMA